MNFRFFQGRIQFNRQELAGSFGDIGTDFPLIVSLILICGLHPASVLIMFGLTQILTGVIYKIPMPVQPLKAMAVIAITQQLTGNILYAGGLAIGILMLVLTGTGFLPWLSKIIPKSVVRGIQFGLGIQLSFLALKDYIPSQGLVGYILSAVSFILVVAFLENKKFPAAVLVILLGIFYAFFQKIDSAVLWQNVGFQLPVIHIPTGADICKGFFILALPQIPLSLGNSILATRQIVSDYFPEKQLNIQKISLTYALLNILKPFFSGIPVCHGSGGIAGHYAFGARTGGSVIIYGGMYLILGAFFSAAFGQVIHLFPKPILGVILLFEGLVLMRLTQDMAGSKRNMTLVILVGLVASSLPYGYVAALILGTLLYYAWEKRIFRMNE